MELKDIAEAIVATAKDEGLTTSVAPCGPAIHREDGASMGLVVAADHSISFYYGNHAGRLSIRTESDLDKALSIGLDFIYG